MLRILREGTAGPQEGSGLFAVHCAWQFAMTVLGCRRRTRQTGSPLFAIVTITRILRGTSLSGRTIRTSRWFSPALCSGGSFRQSTNSRIVFIRVLFNYNSFAIKRDTNTRRRNSKWWRGRGCGPLRNLPTIRLQWLRNADKNPVSAVKFRYAK